MKELLLKFEREEDYNKMLQFFLQSQENVEKEENLNLTVDVANNIVNVVTLP